MKVTRSSVGGPDYLRLRNEADQIVKKLEENNWDFDAVPEVYAKDAQADVVAKEIAVFFNGTRETMIGRLVMAGSGHTFNLMGPHSADAEFRSTSTTVLADINYQLGTDGLREFPAFRRLPKPQRIQFYNRTSFFNIRDLIYWHVIRGAGCFPSALEIMQRHFADGKVVYNNLYSPAVPSDDPNNPAFMTSEGSDLFVSFPTSRVQFNDPSMFGGLVPETMHVEYLLTPEPSNISHPHLPHTGDAKVTIAGQPYYLRRFAGISPKLGLRGPQVPPEGGGWRVKEQTSELFSMRQQAATLNYGKLPMDLLETHRNPLTVSAQETAGETPDEQN
jgi:hypothetical protein